MVERKGSMTAILNDVLPPPVGRGLGQRTYLLARTAPILD
jgi:hypothetical protein